MPKNYEILMKNTYNLDKLRYSFFFGIVTVYRIRYNTDRGNEFKNRIIEEALETFDIRRSLSHKGCPYDNAVAEATYKIIKTEFAFNKRFENLRELERELFDYVNWYNNVRIHSSLDYKTPVEYRLFS